MRRIRSVILFYCQHKTDTASPPIATLTAAKVTPYSPLISIVVTSYSIDRMPFFVALIESITGQSYPNLEVIAVAERSQELYAQISSHLRGSSGIRSIVLFNDGVKGLSAARNLGTSNASGEIVAFVDDDAVLFPDWAERLVEVFDDPSVVGATGSSLPIWEDPDMTWFPAELTWICGCTTWCDNQRPTEVRSVGGMNMAFRKSALVKVGGFSPRFGSWLGNKRVPWLYPAGDDTELSIRVRSIVGGKIIFHPGMGVLHYVERWRLSCRYLAKRSFRAGCARALLVRQYKAHQDVMNLGPEADYLKRIAKTTIPRIIAAFFRSPRISLKQLGAIVVTLSFAALGYCFYRIFPTGVMRTKH